MKTKRKTKINTEILGRLERYEGKLNNNKLVQLSGDAINLASNERLSQRVKFQIGEVVCLGSFLKDGIAGRYPVVWSDVLKIGAALAYLFCPVDAIPDVIPVAGFIDDAAVVGWIVKVMKDSLDRYAVWKNSSSGG